MAKDRLGGKKTLHIGGFLDEFEKDDIKRKVDIVRLFDHFGIRLSKKGKSYIGLCPWHDDKTPSLSVDKEKGLYNCFGCGESGDHFSLVMKIKGCEFKQALAFLKGMAGKVDIPASRSVAKKKETTTGKATTGTKLKTGQKKKPPDSLGPEKKTEPPSPVITNISLDVVCDYYHKKLYENKQALIYLTKTRKIDPAFIRRFNYAGCNIL